MPGLSIIPGAAASREGGRSIAQRGPGPAPSVSVGGRDGLELHVVEIMEDLHIAQALAVDLRRMEYALGHPDQALPIEIRPIPLWVKGMG